MRLTAGRALLVRLARPAAPAQPPDADVGSVAEVIVRMVAAPLGRRLLRVRADPAQDGAEVVDGVADRVRTELLRRAGRAELPSPRVNA